MPELDSCPACKCTWIGAPVPEESKEHYGTATHFKLVIGIYDLDQDMTTRWKCPECNSEFDRFTMKAIPCPDWTKFPGGK